MTDNSQILNWSGQTTAVTVTPSPNVWAQTITIENNSGQVIYARTDGAAAVINAAGTEEIANGATVTLENALGFPNSNVLSGVATYRDGSNLYASGIATVSGSQVYPDQVKDQSVSTNWTSQTAYSTGTPTTLSVIPGAAATGTVNVTFE